MDLNQVTVPSKDVEKSIKFYQKMGLKLIVSALPHYARFSCPTGSSTFSVHLVENLPHGDRIYVYFECENLDDRVHDLEGKGIAFDEKPNDKSWLWRESRLKDPDQNQIILYHAGKNRLNPPWRIN
ncbi:VOC family protein [Portibacter marinus]|uniref:VOC family protein n=1 Tax=Portibacter marinus TaxID=2898660 RepID=UPI001F27D369|nr:VOC family protein [Portibacter marinus]